MAYLQPSQTFTMELWSFFLRKLHCVKSVRIRSYSGLHFPCIGLNTERYRVSLCIQSKCGKIWTRITPNTDTFHAVLIIGFQPLTIFAKKLHLRCSTGSRCTSEIVCGNLSKNPRLNLFIKDC